MSWIFFFLILQTYPAFCNPIFVFTEFIDDIDLATGLEKRELLAHLAGNDDPFHMKPIKRGPSTKDQPTLIPSAFEARIVGCICKYFPTFPTWLEQITHMNLSIS